MQNAAVKDESETFSLGSDRVTVSDYWVVIEARHEMPDWRVREFARIPIEFGDCIYFLRAKEPAEKPYAWRYLLEPWPAGHTETPKTLLTYDAQAVAERDAAHGETRRNEVYRALLFPLYPLLGLLWARTKERLVPLGFVSRVITGVSIFAGFAFALLQLVFWQVFILAGGLSGQLMLGGLFTALLDADTMSLGPLNVSTRLLDLILMAGCFLDSLVRYAQLMREVESPWGFGEWLIAPFRRKKKA
jgi:hypothetical protein